MKKHAISAPLKCFDMRNREKCRLSYVNRLGSLSEMVLSIFRLVNKRNVFIAGAICIGFFACKKTAGVFLRQYIVRSNLYFSQ